MSRSFQNSFFARSFFFGRWLSRWSAGYAGASSRAVGGFPGDYMSYPAFLTDFLQGDTYFKVKRAGHNLSVPVPIPIASLMRNMLCDEYSFRPSPPEPAEFFRF